MKDSCGFEGLLQRGREKKRQQRDNGERPFSSRKVGAEKFYLHAYNLESSFRMSSSLM